ncbi:MAG: hypothetical protein ACYCXZ_03875 [Coriobacteriia bacterium]
MAAGEIGAASPTIKMDSVTLLGRLRDPEAFAGRVRRSPAYGPVSAVAAGRHYRTAGGYDKAWTYPGLLLQVTGPAAYGCMPPVRIEVNCQAHDSDVLHALVGEMYDLTLSRSDIAVDYALPLPEFVRLDPVLIGRSASSIEMRIGRGGAIETIYLGKLRGPRSYRIYNKRLERERSGDRVCTRPWWRVEVQLRYPSEPLPGNAYSGLSWVLRAPLYLLAPKDQLALAALAGDISLKAQLPHGTVRRLRRLAREASSGPAPAGLESPADVLTRERDRLLHDFDAMLGVAWGQAARQKSAATGDCKRDSCAVDASRHVKKGEGNG